MNHKINKKAAPNGAAYRGEVFMGNAERQMPSKCPNCNKDFCPTTDTLYQTFSLKTAKFECNFKIIKCAHHSCGKETLLFYDDYYNFLFQYPPKKPVAIPTEIESFSKNFVEIYNQVLQAASENLNYLIGAGVHKAIEQLVTDYLVFVQKIEESQVLSKSTFGRINMLDKNLYAASTAKLINMYGNDETHYINLERVSVDDAIKLIDNLCILMASRIRAIEADKEIDSISLNRA